MTIMLDLAETLPNNQCVLLKNSFHSIISDSNSSIPRVCVTGQRFLQSFPLFSVL